MKRTTFLWMKNNKKTHLFNFIARPEEARATTVIKQHSTCADIIIDIQYIRGN